MSYVKNFLCSKIYRQGGGDLRLVSYKDAFRCSNTTGQEVQRCSCQNTGSLTSQLQRNSTNARPSYYSYASQVNHVAPPSEWRYATFDGRPKTGELPAASQLNQLRGTAQEKLTKNRTKNKPGERMKSEKQFHNAWMAL